MGAKTEKITEIISVIQTPNVHCFRKSIVHPVFAATRIPMEIIVVTPDKIKITFISSIVSLNADNTIETLRSSKMSDTRQHSVRINRQMTTCIIAGKNTSATATIPTTPTLLFIKDE